MASRLDLHEELCELLGSRNVYFNPPEDMKMKYPAIRYSLSGVDLARANNGIYRSTNQYSLTVIDEDPDSTIFLKLLSHFQMCSLGRPYPAEGLNHFPLTLYY